MNLMLDDKKYSNYKLYESEIEYALDWFFNIRDNDEKGWAWVQFIEPNEQNTAEVVSTVLQNEKWLSDNSDKIPLLVESIEYWLIDVSHAEISIDYVWVLIALQHVRKSRFLKDLLNFEEVEKAITSCIDWLLNNATVDLSSKHVGWSDNSTETLNVIRTSLVAIALSNEIKHLEEKSITYDTKIKDYLEYSINWLISVRNADNGWGNIDAKKVNADYQSEHGFTYTELKYQCDSNPASTGYAILALSRQKRNLKISHILKDACDYLKRTQDKNGCWGVFTETGIRKGTRYTFRHFSTAWVLQGMLESGAVDYTDECVIHGFKYLLELQDKNYGGFKSSPDADNYTWATCNAIMTIGILKEKLSKVSAEKFLGILWDWWDLKKKDTTFSFKTNKTIFAFNGPMIFAFCVTYSIMITLLLFFVTTVISNSDQNIRDFIYSIITVVAAILLGLPWIVYVKNVFKDDEPGWLDSIGWVYGIITGFVLVIYQLY